jgi:SAM-dependent methyltransferase
MTGIGALPLVCMPHHYHPAAAYRAWYTAMRQQHGEQGALAATVGVNAVASGVLERELLRHFGLQPDAPLLDVGCGSGRLAAQLSQQAVVPGAWLQQPGCYWGLDVVPELVQHCRHTWGATHGWRFDVLGQPQSPGDTAADEASAYRLSMVPDASQAMVCLFSVFTHLLPEQTWAYLEAIARVLRPGGRMVASFLEHDGSPERWRIFTDSAHAAATASAPLNVFTHRDWWPLWAAQAGLVVDDIRGADEAIAQAPHPVPLDDGTVVPKGTAAALGQSLVVLRRGV